MVTSEWLTERTFFHVSARDARMMSPDVVDGALIQTRSRRRAARLLARVADEGEGDPVLLDEFLPRLDLVLFPAGIIEELVEGDDRAGGRQWSIRRRRRSVSGFWPGSCPRPPPSSARAGRGRAARPPGSRTTCCRSRRRRLDPGNRAPDPDYPCGAPTQSPAVVRAMAAAPIRASRRARRPIFSRSTRRRMVLDGAFHTGRVPIRPAEPSLTAVAQAINCRSSVKASGGQLAMRVPISLRLCQDCLRLRAARHIASAQGGL